MIPTTFTSRLSIAVGLAAILCVTGGCRSTGPGQLVDPDDPRPGILMRRHLETTAERRSIRGQARFSIDAPDLRLRRPQRIVARRPDLLRVEILALFGQIGAVLTSDGEQYQYLDLSTREMTTGPLDPLLLWQLARIDLSTAEAVTLLLASPQPDARLAMGASRVQPDGAINVSYTDENAVERQRFHFDSLGHLSRFVMLASEGTRMWAVDYSDYRAVGRKVFPHKIEMRFPRVDAEASFHFSQVELDPELPDSLFHLEPL